VSGLEQQRPGTIHHAIHPAMLFADLGHAALDRFGICRIQIESFGLQLSGEGVEPALLACHEAQLTTTRGQLACQRRTDAATCAKDQDSWGLRGLVHGRMSIAVGLAGAELWLGETNSGLLGFLSASLRCAAKSLAQSEACWRPRNTIAVMTSPKAKIGKR